MEGRESRGRSPLAPREAGSLSQKKLRPGGPGHPPAKARSAAAGQAPAPGVMPAGREMFAEATPRRRSEETLRRLGLETALDTVNRLEREGHETEANALREWVNIDPAQLAALLRSLPGTRGGHSRELRLSMCGVAFLARRAGVVGYHRRCCKDRLCPYCSARRSRMFAAALREYLAAFPWPPADLMVAFGDWRVFLTLTQAKVANEAPRLALDRLLAAWRRFLERYGKGLLRGGVRTMEATARKAGARVGDYEVKVPGIHAHLHCIVDVVGPWVTAKLLRRPTKSNKRGDLDRRPRVTLLSAAWTASSPGAKDAGVDVQAVDDDNIYQVCKYPLDMAGLVDVVDGAPNYVRAVLHAMHGRKTVATFGTWKGLQLMREPPGTLEYGDRALYTLATTDPHDDLGARADVHWSSGEVEPAADVLAELLARIASGNTSSL